MDFIRKTFNFPVELEALVKEYQKENMINTFTAAMLELIRKGLQK